MIVEVYWVVCSDLAVMVNEKGTKKMALNIQVPTRAMPRT